MERSEKARKGGAGRESVQKMELEATVALLYLDGKNKDIGGLYTVCVRET